MRDADREKTKRMRSPCIQIDISDNDSNMSEDIIISSSAEVNVTDKRSHNNAVDEIELTPSQEFLPTGPMTQFEAQSIFYLLINLPIISLS